MMNQLELRALILIKEKLADARSELVCESSAKEKGNITNRGNPLFNAHSSVFDALSWLSALLDKEI